MTLRRTGFGILLLTLASVSAMAQGGDPPSRVARLNYLSGPVSFRPGSVDDWTSATLNYPLTNGDHLWVDAGGRAEIHVGSTAVRMDSSTALSILNLDDAVAQFSLTEGTIEVRLRNLLEGDTYEVDTPNASIVLSRPGDYRISAHGDDNVTLATVRSGEADIRAGDADTPLSAGQSIQLTGQDTVSQEITPVLMQDGFDQWCQTRDRRENGSISARYVPREMIGYEDLDQYGVWRQDPRYGAVWVPTGVPAGWAPYHYGHWAWVDPWGWTWIDDAPWGFAPFHYGRWAFAGDTWVWAPGRMDAAVGAIRIRPVYAPALVAFVGGPGFAVGIGVGGGGAGMAAWFALGPGEVYRPAYHVSDMYVRNINIVHVTNVAVINNVNVTYVNQSVRGAVTVVPHDAFVQSRRVSEVAVVVPREQIMRAQVIGSTAQMAPVRESVMGHPMGAGVVVHAPPQRFAERQVVVAHQPPPPPVSFASKEQALRANGGRPLDEGQMNTLRRSAPGPNPMVRTPNSPGRGGAPSGGAAPRVDQARPAVNRPPNNDRPPSARPQTTPQPGQGQPAARPNEARPSEAKPSETHTNEARPSTPRPAEQKAPEARPAETHPTPAAQHEEKKAPPKKRSEPTQKK
jgi:hypothetical protein